MFSLEKTWDDHQRISCHADGKMIHDVIYELNHLMKTITGMRRHYLSGRIVMRCADKTEHTIIVMKNKLTFETSEFVGFTPENVYQDSDKERALGYYHCMAFSSEPQIKKSHEEDDLRYKKIYESVIANINEYAGTMKDVAERLTTFRQFNIDHANRSDTWSGDIYHFERESEHLKKQATAKRALISQFDTAFAEFKASVIEYNAFATTHEHHAMLKDENEPMRKRAYRAHDAIRAAVENLKK